MPDKHFLQRGLLSLSVRSLITFLCLPFSVLLYSISSHLFFTALLPELSINVSFVYHYLHNQYKALFSITCQPSGCKSWKSQQVRPVPNASASKLKYISICTCLKKKFREAKHMNKKEIHDVVDPICILNSIIRIILRCLLF